MGLKTRNKSRIYQIEPFFDKIDLGEIPEDYIELEQKNTNYDLRSKFTLVDNCDVFLYELNPLTETDIYGLYNLRLSIPQYEPGEYEFGNIRIVINKNFINR